MPSVLALGAVPKVTDAAEASARPEMGVLSALAYEDRAVEVVLAAVSGLYSLDDEHRRMYYDLIWSFLGEAVKKELD